MEKMYKRLGRNKMVYMIADINLDEKYLKQFYRKFGDGVAYF